MTTTFRATGIRATGIRATGILAVGVLVLAGCSGSGGDTGTPSGTTSSPAAADVVTSVAPTTASAAPSSATAAPSAGVEPAPSASATAKVSGPEPSADAGRVAAAVVKEIRAADHGSFDRVVVEFTGSFGGWTVEYVDKVIDDPQGNEVALKGSAFLAVRVQKATFDNLFQVGGGIDHVAYAGPHRVAAGLGNVQEIADAGDFEAVMGLGIGVDRKAGVRAYRLSNPSRLVIDVAH